MADIPEQQILTAQHDHEQASKAGHVIPRHLRLYGLAFALVATVIAAAAVAAVVLSRSEESTVKVPHVGDHSHTMYMGHLLLTEWEIDSLASSFNHEIKVGNSSLEIHNDGHTVHSFGIWRGGDVQGDQVVGGILVAQTTYIQPGGVTTLEVDLEPGEYVLVCGVRGHVQRGMHAKVVLE